MNKEILLEKYIKVAVRKALKEQEEQQKRAEKSLYTIYRFPGLKDLMEDLMSPAFGRFLKHVDIVAPKPTTFDIKLINGQDFTIIYIGKGNFTVKVAGKKYNPNNLGELERASQSIADLLQLNYAPEEGKEQPSGGGGEEMGKELAAAETPPAEAPEEKPAEEETPPVAEGLKKKVKTLNEILNEVTSEEEEPKPSIDTKDPVVMFNEFIAQKTLEDKTKEEINKKLSPEQKDKILKSASDNINSIISFLNNNADISDILTPITEGKSGTSLTGPGEVAIITCGKNVDKITSGFGDVVEVSGEKYEIKADKAIRAGGTYRPSVVRLTTTLWMLKQEVFEGDNAEKYKEILGSELFKTWEDLGFITKGKKQIKAKEIDFTSIGKEKLSKIRNFFTALREKIKNISDEDTSKPNVLSVGEKEFELSKDELDKISSSEPGDNVVVKGKVVLSQESNKELQQIRQQLKILLSSKLLNSDEINLDDAIKEDFIKDVDGLIHVVKNKYTLYTEKEFKEKWRLTGITQGNRPSFEPIEETKVTEIKYKYGLKLV